MGLVFQAEDPQLVRSVALKVMRPEVAVNGQFRARFFREARSAAALKHDNVVTIYQVGEDRGVPFLAMEFLKGKSLETWLRPDRRPSVIETLVIGRQLARGLAAAHERGLIHRDIKPANIWLESPGGRVKILDFGLARPSNDDATPLTQANAILGTPAYMAPEQARGLPLDQRCDLFSLGCVLYRMCAGRVPFQGNTTMAVLTALAADAPTPVQDLNPVIPMPLADLVMRLLTKEPANRPQSAQAVAAELLAMEKEWREQNSAKPNFATSSFPDLSEPVAPKPLPRRQRRLMPAIAALLAVLAVVAMLFWPSKPPRKAPSGSRTETALDVTIPPSSSDPPTLPDTPAKPLPINLLERIDPARDAEDESLWSLENGQLTAKGRDQSGAYFLGIPYAPPPEYVMRLKVRGPLRPKGHLIVGLMAGTQRFNAVFNRSYPRRGRKSGFAQIDGVLLESRDSPPFQSGGLFVDSPDAVMEITCTVRTNHIRLEANGKLIEDYQGDVKKLALGYSRDTNDPAPNTPLVLGSWGVTEFQFLAVELEPLGSDPGRWLLPAPPVNLLSRLDPARDAIDNKNFWSLQEDRLIAEGVEGANYYFCRLPFSPPEEYILRFNVSRLVIANGQPFLVGLTVGRQQATVLFDRLHVEDQVADGRVNGFADVNGVPLPKRKSRRPQGSLFKGLNGDPVEIRCTVKRDHVQIHANGELLDEWTPAQGTLSRQMKWLRNKPVPEGDQNPLFLGGFKEAKFEFKDVTLEPLGQESGKWLVPEKVP